MLRLCEFPAYTAAWINYAVAFISLTVLLTSFKIVCCCFVIIVSYLLYFSHFASNKSWQPIQCQQYWTCKAIHRQTLVFFMPAIHNLEFWCDIHDMKQKKNQGIPPAITCFVNTSCCNTENNHFKLKVVKCSSDAPMNWIKQTTQTMCLFLTDLKARLHGFTQDETTEHKCEQTQGMKEHVSQLSVCVSFAYCCLLTCAPVPWSMCDTWGRVSPLFWHAERKKDLNNSL